MADDDKWEFWLSAIGNSDDEDGQDFEGFTVQEVVKGDESDIDLDVMVQNQDLLNNFLTDSASYDNAIADEQSDVDLPAVPGPSRVRIQRRSRKEENLGLPTNHKNILLDIIFYISYHLVQLFLEKQHFQEILCQFCENREDLF